MNVYGAHVTHLDQSPWKGMVFFTGGHPRGARVSSSSGKSSNSALGKSWERIYSNDTPCLLRHVIIKKKGNKLTMGSVTKQWRRNVNLGFGSWPGESCPLATVEDCLLWYPCYGLPCTVWRHSMALQPGPWSCSFLKGRWVGDYSLRIDYWKQFVLFCLFSTLVYAVSQTSI